MFSKAVKDLRGGMGMSHVWLYQAYHDISAKYRRTIFGSLWIVGQMVFMSLSFAVVYGALFGEDLAKSLPHIMTGIMSFTLIGTYLLSDAPEIYLSNTGIISNHAYPFTYYNFESITRTLLIFLHNIVVLEIVLLLVRAGTVPHWTLIIGLAFVIVNMFTWGSVIGMLASRYRDLRFLLPNMAQLIMFVTPVIYDPKQIPASKHFIVDFNPIYPFVEMIRSPLLGLAMPMQYWPMALGVTIAGLIIWFLTFSAFRSRIAFWV